MANTENKGELCGGARGGPSFGFTDRIPENLNANVIDAGVACALIVYSKPTWLI